MAGDEGLGIPVEAQRQLREGSKGTTGCCPLLVCQQWELSDCLHTNGLQADAGGAGGRGLPGGPPPLISRVPSFPSPHSSFVKGQLSPSLLSEEAAFVIRVCILLLV